MYTHVHVYDIIIIYFSEAGMLEKTIEGKIGEAVKAGGGLYYKFVSPGNAGVPDRIAILPGGRVVFIELKSETGRLRMTQHVQIQRLASRGCEVHVIQGMEEAEKFIAEVISA